MEENNQTNGEELQAQTQCPAAEQKEQVVENQKDATKDVQKSHKHNGRNKRGCSKAQSATTTSACGEIQDVAAFQEKLSGSHQKGYEGVSQEAENSENSEEANTSRDRYPRERRERKPRFERRPRFENQSEENAENADEQHAGPAFEKTEFKPRAVEVALDSKNFGSKKEDAPKADFVSSVSVEEPKVSMIARIKRMFANIFSKNSSNGAKFKKNHKDWKNKKGGDKRRQFNNSRGDFHGKKNFRHGGRKFDKNFKPRRDSNAGAPSNSDKA